MFGLFRKYKNKKNAGSTNPADAAMCEFSKGNYKKALAIGLEILKKDTSIAMSWRFVGDCQFKLNMLKGAFESFSNADRIGGPGTEDAFLWMAICKYSAGIKQEAIETLEWYLNNKDLSDEIKSKAAMALSEMKEN